MLMAYRVEQRDHNHIQKNSNVVAKDIDITDLSSLSFIQIIRIALSF